MASSAPTAHSSGYDYSDETVDSSDSGGREAGGGGGGGRGGGGGEGKEGEQVEAEVEAEAEIKMEAEAKEKSYCILPRFLRQSSKETWSRRDLWGNR